MMNEIFKGLNIRKVDLNTGKELEEVGWRKAVGEERQAFLGYYLFGRSIKKSIPVFRGIFVLIFMISLGELLFELLCKGDPSYNPAPMVICIVASVLLLGLNFVIHKLDIKKTMQRIGDCIYVTDAIAYDAGEDKVQLMLNGKKLTFDKYIFKEAVSPTDYVYDESYKKTGFRVLYYIVIADGLCETKVVLGTQGYSYYLGKYKHLEKRDKSMISASA